MTEKIEFGDKLVRLRKSLGFSRPELSERLGIDYQNLYKYETNQRMPDPDVINHLARFFGVTTDHLIGDPDQISLADKQRFDVHLICEQVELHLDGDPLSDEDRDKLRMAISILFTDAHRQNKRIKS